MHAKTRSLKYRSTKVSLRVLSVDGSRWRGWTNPCVSGCHGNTHPPRVAHAASGWKLGQGGNAADSWGCNRIAPPLLLLRGDATSPRRSPRRSARLRRPRRPLRAPPGRPGGRGSRPLGPCGGRWRGKRHRRAAGLAREAQALQGEERDVYHQAQDGPVAPLGRQQTRRVQRCTPFRRRPFHDRRHASRVSSTPAASPRSDRPATGITWAATMRRWPFGRR